MGRNQEADQVVAAAATTTTTTSGMNYLPLSSGDDDVIHHTINNHVDDSSKLNKLGYKQELNRSLSTLANFSVTFSIVSVITGLTTTYSTGLTFGGPVTMVYGWPIVGLLTLLVGLSMAEICSAYPTSGGLYFWSARLCGNQWGPFASWITGWYVIHHALLFCAFFLLLIVFSP